MKLSEFKKRGDEYTSKASDITRQLVFAGIAIIWIFKKEDNGRMTIDSFLIFPLITLTVAIICDLLHYAIAGFIWKEFFKNEEKKAINNNKANALNLLDPEIKARRRLNTPIYFCYWLKISLLVISYVLIIIFLIKNMVFK